MLRLASDADANGHVLAALRTRLPSLDLVRVQDALPEGTHDRAVLEWAAAENRVLITNDRNTMVGFAYTRVAAGQPVPGLIVTSGDQPIGAAADDLAMIAECLTAYEARDRVVIYLPL
jgi:hypothetical protein